MIHRYQEGKLSRQGLTWGWDKYSKPIVVLKIGNFMIWFRRRSHWTMAGNDWKLPRYIYEVSRAETIYFSSHKAESNG